MLQQTQVDTVKPYYERFVARFPDVGSLAAGQIDQVLALWSGLGYYSRARNLHRCAREVVAVHAGVFPDDPRRLAELPGIGRSTAAAIAVFAFGRRAAILDGNVRRVLCRHAGVRGYPGERAVEAELWRIAEAELAQDDVEAYTQGLMDLGATLCVRAGPDCAACPISGDCIALREGIVAEVPTPRPKRVIPLRRCTMFVIRRGGQVLVERRPPSGVWGGLWSLPESVTAQVGAAGADAPYPAALAGEIERRFGLRVTSPRALASFDHAFTHFRLRVQPVECDLVCDLVSAPRAADAPGLAWLALDEAGEAALPRPVKTLLQGLALRSPGAVEGTGGSATTG